MKDEKSFSKHNYTVEPFQVLILIVKCYVNISSTVYANRIDERGKWALNINQNLIKLNWILTEL